jgi:hypothetical protein
VLLSKCVHIHGGAPQNENALVRVFILPLNFLSIKFGGGVDGKNASRLLSPLEIPRIFPDRQAV